MNPRAEEYMRKRLRAMMTELDDKSTQQMLTQNICGPMLHHKFKPKKVEITDEEIAAINLLLKGIVTETEQKFHMKIPFTLIAQKDANNHVEIGTKVFN